MLRTMMETVDTESVQKTAGLVSPAGFILPYTIRHGPKLLTANFKQTLSWPATYRFNLTGHSDRHQRSLIKLHGSLLERGQCLVQYSV